jgi:hypothetical protein
VNSAIHVQQTRRRMTAAIARARYDSAVARGASFLDRVVLWRAYETALQAELARPTASA